MNGKIDARSYALCTLVSDCGSRWCVAMVRRPCVVLVSRLCCSRVALVPRLCGALAFYTLPSTRSPPSKRRIRKRNADTAATCIRQRVWCVRLSHRMMRTQVAAITVIDCGEWSWSACSARRPLSERSFNHSLFRWLCYVYMHEIVCSRCSGGDGEQWKQWIVQQILCSRFCVARRARLPQRSRPLSCVKHTRL